jgi:hyperosmotically inducible periplasmic protein
MFLFASLLSGTWTVAGAQDSSQRPSPDNTKINERDKNSSEPTADQQKENPSDRDITQQIRKAIVKDKSLSTYTHNVKIISQNGMVTLKGPVQSEAESMQLKPRLQKSLVRTR